jgi:hypothetical protein
MNNEMALAIIDNLQPEVVVAAMNKITTFQGMIQRNLKEGHDYGVIPGTQKPTLFKPGAEKILMLMGVTSEYEVIEQVNDYAGGFFAYTVRCTLSKGGTKITEGLGHANTKEARYTNRWVTEKKIPEGIDKETLQCREKEGNWGTYKEYCLANSDGFTLANTVLKMAKKRSQVDATLTIASLSEIFTQDLEDLQDTAVGKESKTTPRARNGSGKSQSQASDMSFCQGCGEQIPAAVKTYSEKNFGRALCRDCQEAAKQAKNNETIFDQASGE